MTNPVAGRVTESTDTGRLRLLYDLGQKFAAHIELDALLPLVTSKCREALDAEGVSVLLLDPEKDELYFPYVAEEKAEREHETLIHGQRSLVGGLPFDA